MYVEFKPGEKHAAIGADVSESMDTFRDCGYLLQKDDVIVDIDCLPKDTIREMLKVFNINTKRVWTGRGVHLYFKQPIGFKRTVNGNCQLGFKFEMFTVKARPHGITVKRDGVAREVENEGILEELPPIFNDRKKFENLLGLGESDGRNNALYAHKHKLAGNPQTEKILRFINDHIFAEPLSDDEFNTVCRTEPEKANDENELSERIMNEYNCVKYMGTIWWYNGIRYITDAKNERLLSLVYNQCPDKNTKFVDEVVKQITYKCPSAATEEDFTIKFKNGYLCPDGEFIESDDYDVFTPYYVSIPYYYDAEPVQAVDDYINKLTGSDPDYRLLLYEILGYSFVTNKERIRAIGKFFMFRGDGQNGKGTLLQIIKKILTPENCTTLSIKQLTDAHFNITMTGKLANLGDDIEPEAINNDQMKLIKNITTCDTVELRHMYHESESVDMSVKLYFTTNSSIKSFEKGYAYKRRVLWLPMFTTVDKVDPFFISKITSPKALKYWIRILMEGYQQLMKDNEWHHAEVVQTYNEEYHKNNNIMAQFIEDLDFETELHGKTAAEVKTAFDKWKDSEEQKMQSKLFMQTLWDKYKAGYGTVKVNGRTARVILLQSETAQDVSPK